MFVMSGYLLLTAAPHYPPSHLNCETTWHSKTCINNQECIWSGHLLFVGFSHLSLPFSAHRHLFWLCFKSVWSRIASEHTSISSDQEIRYRALYVGIIDYYFITLSLSYSCKLKVMEVSALMECVEVKILINSLSYILFGKLTRVKRQWYRIA